MSNIRPGDATHTDPCGRYYKIDAFNGDWLLYENSKWRYVGPMADGVLTLLPPPAVVTPSSFEAPMPRDPYSDATHVDAHGRKYCAHPLKAFEWMMWCDGVWRDCGGLIGVTLFPMMHEPATVAAPDHADELGKVWDVLHANGIESAGEMSASEGVQQLIVAHRLQLDELLYGNSFATVDERGLKTRIDPTLVVMRSRKP